MTNPVPKLRIHPSLFAGLVLLVAVAVTSALIHLGVVPMRYRPLVAAATGASGMIAMTISVFLLNLASDDQHASGATRPLVRFLYATVAMTVLALCLTIDLRPIIGMVTGLL